MSDEFMNFLNEYCHTFKRKAETYNSYLREIQIAESWAGEDISSFDRSMATEYKEYLLSSGLRATTISKKMRVLSAFFSYLESKKVVSDNPFFQIATGETCLNYDPDTIEKDELNIEQALTNIYDSGHYDIYIFAMIVYRLGCKQEDLSKLRIPDDVEFDGKRYSLVLHNYPPFQFSRRIILPLDMTELFARYIQAIPPGYLFLTRNGTPFNRHQLIWALKKYGGITYRALRLHAQVNLLKNGVSPDDVSYAAGTSGRWTKRYVSVAKELGKSIAD